MNPSPIHWAYIYSYICDRDTGKRVKEKKLAMAWGAGKESCEDVECACGQ